MTTRTITPPTIEPLSLAEAKENMNVDVSTVGNDANISGMITDARSACEFALQRALMLQTLETTLDAFPCVSKKTPFAQIDLIYPPVIDVISVTYTNTDGVDTVMPSTDYTLDSSREPAWLVPAYGTDWPATRDSIAAVRVRYRAGYSASTDASVARAAVPGRFRRWMLATVADMYARRNASSDRPSVPNEYIKQLLDDRIWSL